MFKDTLARTATQLNAYCNSSDERKALDELYAPDCVSVEALAMPESEMGQVVEGLDAIRQKHDWWYDAHDVHSSSSEGPFMHGDDKFSLIFEMDVTNKEQGERMQMKEVGLYTVNESGQIIREEFFYPAMSA